MITLLVLIYTIIDEWNSTYSQEFQAGGMIALAVIDSWLLYFIDKLIF